MPIYWFALLIMVLYSASVEIEQPMIERPLLTAVGLVMLWGITAKALAMSAAYRVLSGKETFVTSFYGFRRKLDAMRWFWLLVGVAAVNVGGLSSWIQTIIWAQDSLFLRAGLMLTPSVLMLAALWVAERHYVDWADQRNDQDASEDKRSMVQFLLNNFRTQCAWLFIPVLAVLLIIDICEIGCSLSETVHPLASGLVGIASLPILLPLMLCQIWPTEKLQGTGYAWLQDVARGAGCRGLHTRIWNTQGRISTALVAGFFPGFRVLLLSDALISQLDRAGLTMVTLHELAHVKRHHMFGRFVALVPAWLIAHGASTLLGDAVFASVVSTGLGVMLSALALCVMSHITEYDADRYACQLAASLPSSVGGMPIEESTRSLALALKLVSLDNPKASKASWMHPSITSRIERLHALAITTPVEAPFAETALPAE